MTLHKVLKYLAIVIGVIGLIFLGRIVVAGDDAIKASGDMQASMLDPFIYLTYAVLAVIIVLVAIFVLKGLITGNIKKTLLSIGIFAVVVLISYFIAEPTVNFELAAGSSVDETTSIWVDTGLRTFYILAIVAVGTMVFSGVKKLIK